MIHFTEIMKRETVQCLQKWVSTGPGPRRSLRASYAYEFADDGDESTLCCPLLPDLIPVKTLPETEEDVHVGDVIEGIEYVAGYIGIKVIF